MGSDKQPEHRLAHHQMTKALVQQRINSARHAVEALLKNVHDGKIEPNDIETEVVLGYIRNQLNIITDDLKEC